jgi:dipeptidase E
MGRRPQIVAMGGGGFSMEAQNPLLDDYVLSLTRRKKPKVCFLPSASGDADHYIVRFYRHFASDRCKPSHLSLFRRERGVSRDARTHLLDQDLIYVGGGCVISLLGVWRAHGLDEILREAWQKGVVLCGLSAGSLCWFSESVTAYNGPPKAVAGLGFLPHANTVHYDSEPGRREVFQARIAEGMPAGYASDDGAALHFVGERLHRVVSSRPNASAHRVELVDGAISETPLQAEYLGDAVGARRSARRAKDAADGEPLPAAPALAAA